MYTHTYSLRLEALDRSDVDDVAARCLDGVERVAVGVLLYHDGDHVLAHVEDRVDVCCDDLVPEVDRQCMYRHTACWRLDPGVVDQHVDALEPEDEDEHEYQGRVR